MKILKGLLLFLTFVIDVHIAAEAIYFPRNCWGNTTPCAVENDSGHPLNLKLKSMAFHLDQKTVVATLSENEADVTRGTLFAKHEGHFRWHTPYGDVICESCEIILQRQENGLEIDALKGA